VQRNGEAPARPVEAEPRQTARRLTPRQLLSRFRRNGKGTAAVEFALVAPLFFALLFALLDTAFLLFSTQILETGVHNASRLIRTGQAQTANLNETDFRNTICDEISGIFNCSENLIVDVQVFEDFDDPDFGTPINGDGELEINPNYNPGGGGDIIVVRAFMEHPNFMPSFGQSSGGLANGNRLLASAVTFRNEPF